MSFQRHTTCLRFRLRTQGLKDGRLLAAVLAMTAVGMAGIACKEQPAPPAATLPANQTLQVFVSILPLKQMVERIGGPHVQVSVLLPPNQSEHTYQPSPRQIVSLGEADVYFHIGLAFEQRILDKVRDSVKDLPIVDTRAGIALMPMEQACCEHHLEEGHAHESDETAEPAETAVEGDADAADAHDHADHELDPHIWLDPRLMQQIAATIGTELIRLDPTRTDIYRRNLTDLERELSELDTYIRQTLEPFQGQEFYVYHPAFGYFARTYGLTQVAVEVGGREPTARQLAALTERARAEGIRLIFVQPQFSQGSAKTVAEAIGGAVVPLDGLAEDYLANLRHMADAIRQALTAATSPAPN